MAEKEYIERWAAIKAITYVGIAEPTDIIPLTLLTAQKKIIKIPAADVAEVVWCCECIHRDKKGVCEKFRQRYPFFPEDDFYCGFGAKMDGERKCDNE